MCELRCGIDRAANEAAPCKLGAETSVYKQYVSLNEEIELVPALRVFLGGCNFRCRFCDEAPAAFRPDAEHRIDPRQWAVELAGAVGQGARSISLLGGEPTLHVHTILAMMAASPRPLRLALNTNMYMTPEVLELLDGAVSVYLADFKFGNDACARKLAGISRYMEVVCRNLEGAAASTRVIVRHLLMPGHLECCFRRVADWVARHLPDVRFQLYPGYVPCGWAAADRTIGRLNSRAEVRAAVEYLSKLNLRQEANAHGGPA